MNPSTRLLPSGRGKNIHFYKKHRRVDPIHFTMRSSTKTTQPRDPAKSSHFRRKMAQHKRDQSKPVRPAQPLIEHTRAQTSKTFRPWERQAQHRPEESQTGSRNGTSWSGLDAVLQFLIGFLAVSITFQEMTLGCVIHQHSECQLSFLVNSWDVCGETLCYNWQLLVQF